MRTLKRSFFASNAHTRPIIEERTYIKRPKTRKNSVNKAGKNKWRAAIWLNGIKINLGCFDSELTAGIAYDRMAGKLFGDFAYLNFPELVEFRRFAEKLIFST